MPAELHIKEIEESIESYESKILYGSEIITEELARFYNRVDKHCDGYGVTNRLPIVMWPNNKHDRSSEENQERKSRC